MAATKLASRPLNVSREQVDPNALDVLNRLKAAGFQALLVGGCVRDLLLGAHPKDFDVATSATPEQVRGLFRRSRLVGRRFKIAHVRYGRDIIDVSTFRKAPALGGRTQPYEKTNGMILRDNAYGTLEEDAFRRDFTINALYYDPHSEVILDYVGGIEDIRRNRLRFIGQARERLLEDPVRLLRAIRFQAKLGLELDPQVNEGLADTAARLRDIPSARLFDECAKLFLNGHAENAWLLLEQTPIHKALFPATPPHSTLVRLAMASTDKRIATGDPVTPGFLLAVLLWEDYRARMRELTGQAGRMGRKEAAVVATFEALAEQRRIIALPRRHSHFVTNVWRLQQHLQGRAPRRVAKTLQHRKFRAAYDFLMLRSQAGLVDDQLVQWWTDIQQAAPAQQAEMIAALNDSSKPRRRRRGAPRAEQH